MHTLGLMDLHTGPDPMPAASGWACTFFPADHPDYGSYVGVLRKLWQVGRLLPKLP